MNIKNLNEKNILLIFDLEQGDVVGVDEAGRGPLAGPVVAAAVKLKKYDPIFYKINDSKKLSENSREELFDYILENFHVGIGIATVEEIDSVNILNATFLAMNRALNELSTKINFTKVLVDGNHKIKNYTGEQLPVIKGDSKSFCIAAASIIAKVSRDRIMKNLHSLYPEYDFISNKGYGTKKHREILLTLGPMKEVHRKSFLGKILGDSFEK